MSILITLFGEIIVLIALRCAIKSVDGIIFQKVALFIFCVYLIGIFTVTLGNRTADNVGNINIVLFSTIKHMFSPTANYIKQKDLLRGLRALKWIGYPAWESIVLNFLMLVPLGYLTPCCFRCINRWWKVVAAGFALTIIIESAQLVFKRDWFDVDDIFLNTVGALLGYGLHKCILYNSKTQCKREEQDGK